LVVRAIEHWFVERGVPHFVERSADGSSVLDTWTRALPLLVAAYVLLGLNALDLQRWSVGENALAAFAVIGMALATWPLSNRLRGQATFARPEDIDAPELALFLIGPTLPVLVFGQLGDAFQTLVTGVVLLSAIYIWSAYGFGPLLVWAIRRGRRQITTLGTLVSRALPLLLLFTTFLFINAEVWEMAGTLNGPAYVVVLATFVALGATFALSRVPGTIRSMNTFDGWDDIDAQLSATPAAPLAHAMRSVGVDSEHPVESLSIRQRLNIGLVVLFGQALQITLVSAVLALFFVGFGYFGVTEATSQGWTQLEDVNVLIRTDFGGRQLVLSEPLLRVAAFLGAFTGMYFTVLLTTDDTYRREFSDEFAPEIREALAVRAAYRMARGTYGSRSR
jgi:hypothetical protein